MTSAFTPFGNSLRVFRQTPEDVRPPLPQEDWTSTRFPEWARQIANVASQRERAPLLLEAFPLHYLDSTPPSAGPMSRYFDRPTYQPQPEEILGATNITQQPRRNISTKEERRLTTEQIFGLQLSGYLSRSDALGDPTGFREGGTTINPIRQRELSHRVN